MVDARRIALDVGTLIVHTPGGLVTITARGRRGGSETVILSDFGVSAAAVSFSGFSGVVVIAAPANIKESDSRGKII